GTACRGSAATDPPGRSRAHPRRRSECRCASVLLRMFADSSGAVLLSQSSSIERWLRFGDAKPGTHVFVVHEHRQIIGIEERGSDGGAAVGGEHLTGDERREIGE